MSTRDVEAWLARSAPDLRLQTQSASTATVAEAAAVLGVEPGRIAKSLAIEVAGGLALIVAPGDGRLDNAKVKAVFGGRMRMLDPAATLAATGHEVGGVSPFGLATPIPVYCDQGLRRFPTVFPAAGSPHTLLEVAPERLAQMVGARWADLCRYGG